MAARLPSIVGKMNPPGSNNISRMRKALVLRREAFESSNRELPFKSYSNPVACTKDKHCRNTKESRRCGHESVSSDLTSTEVLHQASQGGHDEPYVQKCFESSFKHGNDTKGKRDSGKGSQQSELRRVLCSRMQEALRLRRKDLSNDNDRNHFSKSAIPPYGLIQSKVQAPVSSPRESGPHLQESAFGNNTKASTKIHSNSDPTEEGGSHDLAANKARINGYQSSTLDIHTTEIRSSGNEVSSRCIISKVQPNETCRSQARARMREALRLRSEALSHNKFHFLDAKFPKGSGAVPEIPTKPSIDEEQHRGKRPELAGDQDASSRTDDAATVTEKSWAKTHHISSTLRVYDSAAKLGYNDRPQKNAFADSCKAAIPSRTTKRLSRMQEAIRLRKETSQDSSFATNAHLVQTKPRFPFDFESPCSADAAEHGNSERVMSAHGGGIEKEDMDQAEGKGQRSDQQKELTSKSGDIGALKDKVRERDVATDDPGPVTNAKRIYSVSALSSDFVNGDISKTAAQEQTSRMGTKNGSTNT